MKRGKLYSTSISFRGLCSALTAVALTLSACTDRRQLDGPNDLSSESSEALPAEYDDEDVRAEEAILQTVPVKDGGAIYSLLYWNGGPTLKAPLNQNELADVNSSAMKGTYIGTSYNVGTEVTGDFKNMFNEVYSAKPNNGYSRYELYKPKLRYRVGRPFAVLANVVKIDLDQDLIKLPAGTNKYNILLTQYGVKVNAPSNKQYNVNFVTGPQNDNLPGILDYGTDAEQPILQTKRYMTALNQVVMGPQPGYLMGVPYNISPARLIGDNARPKVYKQLLQAPGETTSSKERALGKLYAWGQAVVEVYKTSKAATGNDIVVSNDAIPEASARSRVIDRNFYNAKGASSGSFNLRTGAVKGGFINNVQTQDYTAGPISGQVEQQHPWRSPLDQYAGNQPRPIPMVAYYESVNVDDQQNFLGSNSNPSTGADVNTIKLERLFSKVHIVVEMQRYSNPNATNTSPEPENIKAEFYDSGSADGDIKDRYTYSNLFWTIPGSNTAYVIRGRAMPGIDIWTNWIQGIPSKVGTFKPIINDGSNSLKFPEGAEADLFEKIINEARNNGARPDDLKGVPLMPFYYDAQNAYLWTMMPPLDGSKREFRYVTGTDNTSAYRFQNTNRLNKVNSLWLLSSFVGRNRSPQYQFTYTRQMKRLFSGLKTLNSFQAVDYNDQINTLNNPTEGLIASTYLPCFEGKRNDIETGAITKRRLFGNNRIEKDPYISRKDRMVHTIVYLPENIPANSAAQTELVVWFTGASIRDHSNLLGHPAEMPQDFPSNGRIGPKNMDGFTGKQLKDYDYYYFPKKMVIPLGELDKASGLYKIDRNKEYWIHVLVRGWKRDNPDEVDVKITYEVMPWDEREVTLPTYE